MGILLKNENKLDEMVDIIGHLHQYVPSMTFNEQRHISTGEIVSEECARLHPILIGGDQVTVVRARSAIKIKLNSQSPCRRLSGAIPVIEDWHAKVIILEVSHIFHVQLISLNQNLVNRNGLAVKP